MLLSFQVLFYVRANDIFLIIFSKKQHITQNNLSSPWSSAVYFLKFVRYLVLAVLGSENSVILK